ncbi:hypothetical protein COBT_001578 [Conglomerata obtusa]
MYFHDIKEAIIKSSPSEYQTLVDRCITNFNIEKDNIMEAINEVLLYIPGSFFQLALIIDLSQNIKEFSTIFINNIQVLTEKNINDNQLINLLLNILFLEKYQLIKRGETDKILKLNKIEDLGSFLKSGTQHLVIIAKTRKETDIPLNLTFEDIVFDSELIIQINKKITHFIQCKNYFNDVNADALLTAQLINYFSFSTVDCRFFLINYFCSEDYIQLLYGMFLKIDTTEKAQFYAIFLLLTRLENFLKQFYELVPRFKQYFKDTNNKESQQYFNTLMALLYERFYYPTNEMSSFYKESCQYDPLYSQTEAEMYSNLLDDDIVIEMLKFSDLKQLKKYLNPKFHHFLINEKVIEESKINLKDMIHENSFEKIQALNKEDFFNAFFSISKHSISHFLTYMEMLQQFFVLNKEEQELFCVLFEKHFNEKHSFKKFVCEKLVLFKVIDDDIQKNHSQMFDVGNLQ